MAKVDTLLKRLDLERLDADLFRGTSPNDGRPRIFGGLVASQSLIAACRTVEDRSAHSLHSYFLHEGDPSTPVIYHVDRIRNGRSFATRRVVARQHGRAIFNLSVSFQADEDGLTHQTPMPDTPPPQSVPSNRQRMAEYAKNEHPVFKFLLQIERPIEQRDIDHIDPSDPKPFADPHRLWFKADGALPDDPVIHQGVLTYATDLQLLDSCINYHGKSYLTPDLMLASLDHTIWFHRPFRFDDWMLYVTESPNAAGGRGLNFGRIYAADGTLAASVAQESLMRIRRDR